MQFSLVCRVFLAFVLSDVHMAVYMYNTLPHSYVSSITCTIFMQNSFCLDFMPYILVLSFEQGRLVANIGAERN
jgi:hypothetical protein